MFDIKNLQTVYFLGIGGIGMSALARYYHSRGFHVLGYDHTASHLTHDLETEGMQITYFDDVDALSALDIDPVHTLVVRTPAVPEDTAIFTYFRNNGYTILKRAEVLGMVTKQMKALCVAGTHGKTTTSTILAHLMYQSEIGTNAFLGGISNNYGTNILLQKDSNYVVVEADEYDRSFHHLTPYMSVITAVDPDHLDVYGTPEAYRESFEYYTSLIQSALIIKKGLNITPRLKQGAKLYTYSATEEADFYADNIRVDKGNIYFDFHTPTDSLLDLRLGVPVWVNIENSVAAMAVAWLNGVSKEELRLGLLSYSGVYRRFNIHVNNDRVAYVDDYAHHPTEIQTSIDSVRRLFPDRHFIGIFQPHLYTRTRDFADDFARVLSTLDEVVLLPIYPARELPILGVTSDMLLSKINCLKKALVEKADLVQFMQSKMLSETQPVVVMTIGAGDIDRLVPDLAKALSHK
ncbi:MAG: UDP-N-acetylmuramate--L-alanine ligase [Paludibacteraceae bacterium]|nr:UDP-N-acetylmuramate--L-alanine ligase [Bacteroidales bacterium]MDY4149857.1 UDP-N-acetylmuramate--L-alanine ligase [Paludibacteraceae bacterium]